MTRSESKAGQYSDLIVECGAVGRKGDLLLERKSGGEPSLLLAFSEKCMMPPLSGQKMSVSN